WNNNIGSDYIVKEGEPVGLMYGFVTDGFYSVDDFNYDPVTETYTLKYGVADNEDLLFAGFGPGSVKFKDINSPIDSMGNFVNDSCKVTTEDDRVIIGNANPKHTGGLNISMSYKWIDFSVFMNWVYGNDIYNANLIEFSGAPKLYTNLLDIMAYDKRWKTIDENGQVVTDPDALKELNKDAVIWKPQPGRVLFHSWAVEDGSFLRINNITLGITAPKKWTQKIHIQKLRFYTTVYNAFLFTNYSGYDPEVNTRRRTPLTPGVDYSAYPRSRSFIFGLNLTL
ncbi:MAG: hypothetical protein JXB49_20345, partial [Bacteroidales bacterium]|nr:hypothetical protein [Bacteroidales bacterium]